jgi:outer membrane cobalamin receptor
MPRPRAGAAGRFLITTLIALAGFVLAAPTVAAEVIRGQAKDPQQRAVPLADVILTQGSRVVATAKTAADGRFGPIAAPPGEYELVISAAGLQSAPQRVVVTAAAGDLNLDVPLKLAAMRESVVVSASQVDRSLSRVADSVTVFEATDLITRQTETVADAVRGVPGFGVVRSGGRGAVTSFFPRGGESNYTLVLADGIPLNAFGGGFDAGHLGAAEVERIEIVRGPQSALYGADAIGGVVHVITRNGGPLRGDVSFAGGGYGTAIGRASAAGSRGAWSWGGAIDWTSSDGDTREFASAGGAVSNDDYERLAGSGSVSWSDRSTRRVRIDARFGRDERGNPGPYGSDPLGLYGGLDTVSRGVNHTRGIGAHVSLGGGPGPRHLMQLSWADAPSEFTTPFGDSEDATRRLTGRYQIDWNDWGAGWSAGWEGVAERADNTFITGEELQAVPVKRSLNGFFVESRWQPGGRATATAGIRVERIARSALEGNPNPFGPRPAFDTDVVWSANPKASVAWTLQRDPGLDRFTRLHASAGTGIKPPTAFEIAFTDNPSLEPERSRSLDIGVQQGLGAGVFIVDATWFYNRYDQLIVTVGSSFAGASRYRTDNVANARATGVEVGASWRGPGGLAARGAWTWLETEVLAVDNVPGQAPPPYSVGDALIRRPGGQGLLDVTWTSDRVRAVLTINGRTDTTDIEPNFASSLFTNPGYVTTMAGVSVGVGAGVEVFGRVSNLFNQSYEEALGFPALGRAAMLGVRIARSR